MLIGSCVQLILSRKHQKTRLLLKISKSGVFLVVQWLRLHASTSRAMGLIPGWGTKIPYTVAKKKKKKNSKSNQQIGLGWSWFLYHFETLEKIVCYYIFKILPTH